MTSRRLCSRASCTVSIRLRSGLRRMSGIGISRRPDRYAPVRDRSLAISSLTLAADDHLAAVLAGAWSDVDDPVGGVDGVLVVLDDDQRVAEIPQPDQRLDQAPVVPLVQADARLVQDVQHADQPAADLGRQPDPLRLAAGEGGRPPRSTATGSRARRRAGSGAGRRSPSAPGRRSAPPALDSVRPPRKSAHSPIDIEALGDRAPADGDGERLGLEPGALAGAARARPACSPRSAHDWCRSRASRCRRSRNGIAPSK